MKRYLPPRFILNVLLSWNRIVSFIFAAGRDALRLINIGVTRGTKFFFVFLTLVFLFISAIVSQKYPFGVKQYKTVTLGMRAAESGGVSTVWAPPFHVVPESLFYVYALGDEHMCIGSDCGAGGFFVECLGGWLSGYKVVSEEFDYGLSDAGVNMKKQTIITVANKDARIVGIYPDARIRNLPYIMRNHRNLVSDDRFKKCSDLLSRRRE